MQTVRGIYKGWDVMYPFFDGKTVLVLKGKYLNSFLKLSYLNNHIIKDITTHFFPECYFKLYVLGTELTIKLIVDKHILYNSEVSKRLSAPNEVYCKFKPYKDSNFDYVRGNITAEQLQDLYDSIRKAVGHYKRDDKAQIKINTAIKHYNHKMIQQWNW